ncbi:hypothetical protein [Alteraurantiacibacter palmitatis]|uniref:DUF2914 domain-containing protein n=1 Tax=Alteraurantiacibacter palmitatis TaxID=2054628 RepID=A0ABV7E491_9SPHN
MMPVPLKFLLIAAQIAQDERAQKMARSVWQAGTELLDKRRKGGSQVSTPPPAAVSRKEPVRPGWQGSARNRWRFRSGQRGDLIRFEYTDGHGLVTQRMVGNWSCKGGELTGYCLNRREEVAFAISGIGHWEEIEVRCE